MFTHRNNTDFLSVVIRKSVAPYSPFFTKNDSDEKLDQGNCQN